MTREHRTSQWNIERYPGDLMANVLQGHTFEGRLPCSRLGSAPGASALTERSAGPTDEGEAGVALESGEKEPSGAGPAPLPRGPPRTLLLAAAGGLPAPRGAGSLDLPRRGPRRKAATQLA